MHHMETVRKDVTLKYLATSRKLLKRERIDQLVNNINSVNKDNLILDYQAIMNYRARPQPVTICDNIFNIPYQEWVT